VDLDTLHTLPDREYRSGLAEVVKYGVIWDEAFFTFLEGHVDDLLRRDVAILSEVIRRSCEIKADVVRQDEREGGLRAILNFGHTLGHAIEHAAGYGKYLHGEAIAAGMVYAAELSVAETGLEEKSVRRIRGLLEQFQLPVAAPDCDWNDLWEAMQVDKKSVGHRPRFVLAERLGAVRYGCPVVATQLEKTWAVLHP
jgi:3-dehydroquinate synthase